MIMMMKTLTLLLWFKFNKISHNDKIMIMIISLHTMYKPYCPYCCIIININKRNVSRIVFFNFLSFLVNFSLPPLTGRHPMIFCHLPPSSNWQPIWQSIWAWYGRHIGRRGGMWLTGVAYYNNFVQGWMSAVNGGSGIRWMSTAVS